MHGMEEQPEVPGHHLENAELHGFSIYRQVTLLWTAATAKLSLGSGVEVEL